MKKVLLLCGIASLTSLNAAVQSYTAPFTVVELTALTYVNALCAQPVPAAVTQDLVEDAFAALSLADVKSFDHQLAQEAQTACACKNPQRSEAPRRMHCPRRCRPSADAATARRRTGARTKGTSSARKTS